MPVSPTKKTSSYTLVKYQSPTLGSVVVPMIYGLTRTPLTSPPLTPGVTGKVRRPSPPPSHVLPPPHLLSSSSDGEEGWSVFVVRHDSSFFPETEGGQGVSTSARVPSLDQFSCPVTNFLILSENFSPSEPKLRTEVVKEQHTGTRSMSRRHLQIKE